MSLAHNSSAPTVSLKAYLAYLIVSLYLFFEMAVQVSPSVMVDVLQRDLHVSLFALGIMSGAYFYTYTLMQVPVGLLFDRYSSRLIIATAILLCAAGCLVFSLSTHFYSATIARLLTGMGSAFAFVSVLVVSAQYFPRRYFPVMAGLGQMLAALGALSGQMPLNVLVTHYGWRHTMGLLCAIGLVLAVVVWVVLSGRAGQLQAQAAKRIEQATAAGVQRLLTYRQQIALASYAFLLWAPMSGFASLWGVSFLKATYSLSAATASAICSLMWLGLALASPLLGALSTRYRSRKIPLVVMAALGGLAFSALLWSQITSLFWVGLFVFLSGAACSGQALTFTVIRDRVAALGATKMAINNMMVVISGAVFQPLIGYLLNTKCAHLLSGAPLCTPAHWRLSLLCIAVCYVVAFFIACFGIKESFIEG